MISSKSVGSSIDFMSCGYRMGVYINEELPKKRKSDERENSPSHSKSFKMNSSENGAGKAIELNTIEDTPERFSCERQSSIHTPQCEVNVMELLDNINWSNSSSSSDSEIEISSTPPSFINRCSFRKSYSTSKHPLILSDSIQNIGPELFEADEPSLLNLSSDSLKELTTSKEDILVTCSKQNIDELKERHDINRNFNEEKVDTLRIESKSRKPKSILDELKECVQKQSITSQLPVELPKEKSLEESNCKIKNNETIDIRKEKQNLSKQVSPPLEQNSNDSEDVELELIKFYLRNKNLQSMYSWQKKCLQTVGKKNMIVSLPTSAGKTLVAELLMLKEIVIFNKSVIFILPYVALVQEKCRSLSSLAIEMDFFLEEYAGVKGSYPPVRRRNDKKTIYICTIEKSSSLINSFISEKRLDEIGLVVVDEIHILNEFGRGAILECLLTKLMYCKRNIQIFAMSATIGNIEQLATFIKGEPFIENFRPTSLKEYIKVDKKLFIVDNQKKGEGGFITLAKTLSVHKQSEDPDDISLLLQDGLPALIFCSNKKSCNNLSRRLKLDVSVIDEKVKEKQDLLEALRVESNGHLCSVLTSSIPYGIAYHHSGLSSGERKLIEEAYLDGTLKIICCTSTLAAGINLPAKRVIIREPYVGRDFISLNMYKQMVGRAGRTGMQQGGESVIICKTEIDSRRMDKLLRGGFERVVSKFDDEVAHDLIISVIQTQICSNLNQIKDLFTHSLMYQQIEDEKRQKFLEEDLPSIIDLLIKNEAVRLNLVKDSNESSLTLTNTAKAAVYAGLSLQESKIIYKDLYDAKKKLCILNSVHILSLVIPLKYRIADAGFGVEFKYLMKRYSKFNKTEVLAAEMIGVTEHLIATNSFARRAKYKETRHFLCQFLHAVVLYDVLNHEDVWAVSKFYNLTLGELYNFISETIYYAAKIYRFCECLGEFWAYKQLLTDLPQKLSCCRTPEVISLMELPGVKMGRAKQLYNAGFTNFEKIASARVMDLVKSINHMPKGVARNLISSAKMLIQREIDENESEIERILKENARKKQLHGPPQTINWKKGNFRKN